MIIKNDIADLLALLFGKRIVAAGGDAIEGIAATLCAIFPIVLRQLIDGLSYLLDTFVIVIDDLVKELVGGIFVGCFFGGLCIGSFVKCISYVIAKTLANVRKATRWTRFTILLLIDLASLYGVAEPIEEVGCNRIKRFRCRD